MKKVTVISLFVAVSLLTNNAFAGLILPESSFDGGHWQGYRIYEEEGYHVLVDFAVYDTQGENEFVEAGFTAPGDGRYIYAYQIFNHPDAVNDLESFAIFPLGDGEIDETVIDGLGSQNDNDGGIAPLSAGYDLQSRIVWKFSPGILVPGLHSYFLLFSSDNAPVAGDYTVKGFEDEGEFPSPDTPEPATVVLLGTGAALAVLRRRKPK